MQLYKTENCLVKAVCKVWFVGTCSTRFCGQECDAAQMLGYYRTLKRKSGRFHATNKIGIDSAHRVSLLLLGTQLLPLVATNDLYGWACSLSSGPDPVRKTPSRKDISPKNTRPNGHFPKNLFSRMDTWPNGHFPECTFSKMDTCQNVHLTEWTLPRNFYTPPPPIGMSTKMQNRKNTTFLALLRLFYALEWTKW